MANPDTPTLDTDDAESTAPESTLSLKRSPTASSYYDFDQMPWDGEQGQSWMYARHARAQQRGLRLSRFRFVVRRATKTFSRRKYPSYFGNIEKLPLNTKPGLIFNRKKKIYTIGWLHHPLIPGHTTTFSGNKRKYKPNPGMVRSFYAPKNPVIFDVAYHTKENGESKNGEFKMATYHPAVKQVNEIGVVAGNSDE
ncbi:unnamed protein product, partial [Clonostachys solani]